MPSLVHWSGNMMSSWFIMATAAMMNWETSAVTWASVAPTTQLKVCCRCRAIAPVSVVPEVSFGR